MKKRLLLIALLFSATSFGQIVTDTLFYSGSYDSLTIACSDSIELTVFGAQGVDGTNIGGTGGLGAMASGKLAVSFGDVLYFFVGGQAGFNGGALPGAPAMDNGGITYACGIGGDASDVRLNSTSLSDRVIVAAGGGGGSAGPLGTCANGAGGSGGNGGNTVAGLNGTSGAGCGTGGTGGTGGTATDGGTGGLGNSNCSNTGLNGIPGTIGAGGIGGDGIIGCSGYTGAGGGGGGGGFYGGAGGGCGAGGGSGAWGGGGGAGGASYIALVNDASSMPGVNTGMGYIVISYTPGVSSTSSIVESACSSYTSPSGNNTWTSTGIYTDTLTASNGCDSLINIDLTVNNPSSSSLTINSCEPYVSPSGNNTWNATGIYTDTIPNAEGCDSVLTINLTITTLDASVSTNAQTITSNATGVAYQWLNCNNQNAEITGATSPSFTAIANGSYAVEISLNGCIDTSACTVINDVSLIQFEIDENVTLYPNPNSGKMYLKFGEVIDEMNVTVNDAVGRIVYSTEMLNSDILEIDIELLPGMYQVQLVNPEGKTKQIQFVRK